MVFFPEDDATNVSGFTMFYWVLSCHSCLGALTSSSINSFQHLFSFQKTPNASSASRESWQAAK